jgi:hypothetical protein
MNFDKFFEELFSDVFDQVNHGLSGMSLPPFHTSSGIRRPDINGCGTSLRDSVLRKPAEPTGAGNIRPTDISPFRTGTSISKRQTSIQVLPDGSYERIESVLLPDGSVEETVTTCDSKNICKTFINLLQDGVRRPIE